MAKRFLQLTGCFCEIGKCHVVCKYGYWTPSTILALQIQDTTSQLKGNSWFARASSSSVIHWLMEARDGVTEEGMRELNASGKNAKTPPSLLIGLFTGQNGEALVTPFKLFTLLTKTLMSSMQQLPNAAATQIRQQTIQERNTLATAVFHRQGHKRAQKNTDSKETESKLNAQEKEWQERQNPLGFHDRLKCGISKCWASSRQQYALSAF